MRLFRLRRSLLAALPGLAVWGLLTSSAYADSLAVEVAPELALPAESVKSAIAAELGAQIVDGSADLGSVDVRLDDQGQLAVTYARRDGTQLLRTVALPALPADRLALIAFVTGNLVRDQLAELGTPAPAEQTEDVTSPGAPIAPGAVVAAEPAYVIVTRPPPHEAAEATVPVSIGFVPPLSTDRLWTSRASVRASLNVLVGATSSVHGMAISGVADLSAKVRGLQIGGVASIAGDTSGLQVAGALTIASQLHGGQLAGAAAVARDIRGLQSAGAVTIARDVRGYQIAGAVAAARDVVGLQVAGGATAARDVRGTQIAGGAAVAGRVDGVQIAGGPAIAGRFDGTQIASINVAGSADGAQIGAINIAGRARGLQLGAINISNDNEGVQIGALNFVRHGRTDVEAWAETTGLSAIALRHGGRHVHNVYAIGWSPDGGKTPLIGFGLGFHRRFGSAMLDLDAMGWQTHMFDDGIGLLTQARATLAIDIGPVAGFVAAAYNVSVEDDGEMRPLKTALARTVGEPMSAYDVALWPSLAVGVRAQLGARK